MHIVALGADGPGKQECEPLLLKMADHVIVDSLPQAAHFGDSYYACQAGAIRREKLQEMGQILYSKNRLAGNLIITDLTGIAAQDMAIADFVLHSIRRRDKTV